jgi:hypothetical protein
MATMTDAMTKALDMIRNDRAASVPMGTLKALRDRGLVTLSVTRGRRTSRGQEFTVIVNLLPAATALVNVL